MHYGDGDNGLLHLNPPSQSQMCVCGDEIEDLYPEIKIYF